MSTINDTDLLLVERNGVQYQITYDQMSTLNDDDLLLVERGGVQYKVEAQDISTGANGLIIPPVEVLTPVNGAGITEFDQYEPVSSAITVVGEAGTIAKNTDEIQSVTDISNWNQSQVWSSGTYTGSQPPSSNYAVEYAFNENGEDGGSWGPGYYWAIENGGEATLTFSSPITLSSNSTLEILGANYEWVAANGGGMTFTCSNGSVPVTLNAVNNAVAKTTISDAYTTFGSQITAITLTAASNGWMSLVGLFVDGKRLVDAGIAGATIAGKLLSFPTNTNFSGLSVGNVVQTEYATWDSTTEGGVQSSTFSADNLTVTTSNTATTHVKSSLAFPTSGKWYSELTIGAFTYMMVGVIAASSDTNYPSYLHQKTESYIYYLNTLFTTSGSGTSTGTVPSVSTGDVLGILLDLDNQEMRFSVNGTVYGGFNSVTNTVPLAIAISDHDTNHTASATLNAGQSPWAHEPPSGYLGLSNPEATITAINASGPSQTEEYATFNPVGYNANQGTMTNGNLTLSATSNYYIEGLSTLPASSSNNYTELTISSVSSNPSMGFAVGDKDTWIITGGGTYLVYRESGTITRYPGNTTVATVASYTQGDVLGMAVDNTNVKFYKNGSLQGTYAHQLTGEYFVTAMTVNGNVSGYTTLDVNFGATAFTHTPPSGYTGLSETVTTYPSVTVDGGTWDTSNQSQVWSSGVVGAQPSKPAANGFDGDEVSECTAATGEDLVITFSGGLVITDKLEGTGLAPNITINEGLASETIVAVGAGWQTIVNTAMTIQTIKLRYDSGAAGGCFNALRADGKLLIDAVNDSQPWSSYGTGVAYPGGYDWDKAFNGETPNTDQAAFATSASVMTWTPPTPITVNSELVIYASVTNVDQLLVNGSPVKNSTPTYSTPITYTAAEIGGQLSSIEIGTNNSNVGTYLSGISIDGEPLTDPGVRDFGDRYLGSSIPYEKSLTFTDTTELANIVGPLEMTDANGDVVTPVSDTIANVSNNVLTLQGNTNIEYFQPGDEVQTGVEIVSVDTAAPSITVDGGEWLGADGTNTAKKISRSLRFDSASSSYLSRTPSSAGNRKTWTWSGWVKKHTNMGGLFTSGTSNNAVNYITFGYNNSDTIAFLNYANGFQYFVETTSVYRDPNAWYHIVVAFDSTQSTDTDRIKIYVNGVRQTELGTPSWPAQDFEGNINAVDTMAIGSTYGNGTGDLYSGYLADVHFVDGQALAPTNFGEFDDNNVWQAKAFSGTYGTNGFHLDFADNSSDAALGATNDYATTVGAVTTSYPDFYAAGLYPPNNLFDGIATSSAIVYGGYSNADGNSGNSDIIWTPNGAYSVSSTLRVFAGYYSNISVNGVSLATGASQTPEAWVTLAHTGPITSIKFENLVDDYAVRAAAIEIDGTILTTTAWTVNNLSVSSGYINNSVLTGDIYSGAGGVDKMFDGTTATCGPTSGAYVTFTPSTPIPINSSLRIRANVSNTSVDADFAINGSAVSTVSTGFPGDGFIGNTASTWTTISNPPSSLTSLRFGFGGSWMALSGIEIDGVVLTDIPGADDDSLVDVPANYGDGTGAGGEVRGNYCTLNPLAKNSTVTLSNGNLDATSPSWAWAKGTMAVSSGKWYWEVTRTYDGVDALFAGIAKTTFNDFDLNFAPSATGALDVYGYGSYSGQKLGQALGSGSSYGDPFQTAGDVIGVALDMDAGTLTFYKNGVSQGQAFSGIADQVCPLWGGNGGNAGAASHNFGQRAFVYAAPSGYKALCDTNLPSATIKDGAKHFDVVTYTGNSSTNVISGLGFSPDLVWIKNRTNGYSHSLFDTVRGAGKRLSSDGPWEEGDYNLLNSFNSDGFTLGTDAGGNAYVQNETGVESVAWCWNAGDTTETIAAGSLGNYNTDRVWSDNLSVASGSFDQAVTNAFNGDNSNKARTSGDAVLVTLTFSPALTVTSSVELIADFYAGGDFQYTATIDGSTTTQNVTGANPAIFGSGSLTQLTIQNNAPGRSSLMYVKVDGATLVNSNTAPPTLPSIGSEVRANPAAGFSIVSVTEAAASGGSTVAHGLNAKPQMIIEKSRTGSTPWYIHHSGLGDMSGSFLRFDGSAKQADNAWNIVEPTSTTFGIDPNYVLGDANADVIYYLFAPVEGYSAMGSYTGNGSDDGPFVFTGMRPKWVMIKAISSTSYGNWVIHDTERSTTNVSNKNLYANLSNSEDTTYAIDFLANGFKIRSSSYDAHNADGKTYIYYAIAENPVAQDAQVVTTGDTQVALDPLAAIATEIVETDGTTMYLNGATGPWRTGLSIEGSQINAAPPGPSEISFTSQNQGTPVFSGVDATLASRTWTLESSTTATGPWTQVDTYNDFGVLSTQTGATPWTENKPTLQPNTFYRIKVAYNSTNAESVESVYNTFKTGDA